MKILLEDGMIIKHGDEFCVMTDLEKDDGSTNIKWYPAGLIVGNIYRETSHYPVRREIKTIAELCNLKLKEQ